MILVGARDFADISVWQCARCINNRSKAAAHCELLSPRPNPATRCRMELVWNPFRWRNASSRCGSFRRYSEGRV